MSSYYLLFTYALIIHYKSLRYVNYQQFIYIYKYYYPFYNKESSKYYHSNLFNKMICLIRNVSQICLTTNRFQKYTRKYLRLYALQNMLCIVNKCEDVNSYQHESSNIKNAERARQHKRPVDSKTTDEFQYLFHNISIPFVTSVYLLEIIGA